MDRATVRASNRIGLRLGLGQVSILACTEHPIRVRVEVRVPRGTITEVRLHLLRLLLDIAIRVRYISAVRARARVAPPGAALRRCATGLPCPCVQVRVESRARG